MQNIDHLITLAEENNVVPNFGEGERFYTEYNLKKKHENRLGFWLRFDKWNLAQAALIFVDIQPDTLNLSHDGDILSYKSFSGNFDIVQDVDERGMPVPIGRDGHGIEIYLTHQQYDLIDALNKMVNDNTELLRRLNEATPQDWVHLAIEKEIAIPWLSWAVDNQYLSIKKNKSENKASSRERETMLKIIYAIAKNGYKYPERSTLNAMVKDFEIHCNGVSEKTLKKYLDEFDAL